MVRTIVYFVFASIVLGAIAVPGLAAFALVLAPLAVIALVWRFALTVATHGHPSEAVVHAKRSHLLGPGGPDDSFADYEFDADEYPQEAPSRAKAA